MQCDLCGGLVTWRGPLSALTHTECENCGGQNCQVAQQPEEAEEPQPEMLVGHSEMQGGWCVYVQSARAEYDVVRGPFPSQDQAYASMDRLLDRSNTPNGSGEPLQSARPRG
jgi:hypothetical protein